MFTGITSQIGALVTSIVVLTGGAILRGGTAAADPNQDDQFLALLNKEGIPAISGVPNLIATAHRVCRALDGGVPVGTVVEALVNFAYSVDPAQDRGRYERTETRFVRAAVGAYCPGDRGKVASIMANPAPASNGHHCQSVAIAGYRPRPLDMINLPAPWQQPRGTGAVRLPHLMDGGVFVAGRWGDDRSDCDAHGTVLASLIGAAPSGENTRPDPPQIPPPPPPTAQLLVPPPPIAPPPPPKRPPPPPKQPPPPPEQPPPPPEQPPPPPQQVEPPAVAPQPGDAAGSGGGGNGGKGGGGNGGGGPAEPAPARPPGFVRLAP